MSPEQIQRIREHELRTILSELSKGCRILEIGVGTKRQKYQDGSKTLYCRKEGRVLETHHHSILE